MNPGDPTTAPPAAGKTTVERLEAPVFGFLAYVGTRARGFLFLLSDLYWFMHATVVEMVVRVKRGRPPFRAATFFLQTQKAGVGALFLIIQVAFFLGATTALLTGYQLEPYGTVHLVPGLVAVSFTRELGALITGIVLAARTGAAFAAELSTMQISEEVDAIESMGIGPLRYLVAPRVCAIVAVMPCLVVVANASAMLGAALVAKTQLHMGTASFVDLAFRYLLLKDVTSGLIKSLLFGLIIGVISCYRGLTVQGGAAGVGRVTTGSVVASIGTVIAVDTLINFILIRSF